LVGHSGKSELVVSNEAIFADSPESDWDGLIGQFTAKLNENALINTQALIADFSTTGAVERLVSQICLLDVFEPYFEFIVYTVCGIPEVLLEGSAEDWQRLRNKIDLLEPYNLNWWLLHLREIADELHNAATGNVNLPFWQNIYKRKDAYGYDVINGWIVKLIPYLKNDATGKFDDRAFFLL
jgi:hypothetical protein